MEQTDNIPHARRPVIVVGPTAGGKSDLAVALALALAKAGEPRPHLINADSMQVYRRMDAGTAKPPAELRAAAVHHLLDEIEPTQRFTVHDWLARTEAILAELDQAGTRGIIVGGTNLYLQAFLQGMFTREQASVMREQDEGNTVKETGGTLVPPEEGYHPALRAELEQLDNDALHRRLEQVDPDAAQRIHRNDRKKAIRAIEVFTTTGRPISALQQQWTGSTYRHDPIIIGLDWPTPLVNRRINARVKEMFASQASVTRQGDGSLLEEVRQLEAAGLLGPQARLALGYKQVLEYLAGKLTLDQAMERTKIETRRFAKRQRTWLRRFTGVHWLTADPFNAHELAAQAVRIIQSAAGQT